jgi:peptidoglycan/LPS O-acetylase OafA/YrhL
MAIQSREQISALTGLRFFAAAMVVIFHFAKDDHFTNFIHHGAFGVTIFFVLSGFILAYSYSTGPGSIRGNLRAFWVARFARLYPVYLLGIVLFLPIVLNATSEPVWKRGATLLLSLTALQSWFHTLGLSWGMWNPPGWSLSAEAFFYLVFPLACLPLSKLSARQLVYVALACWICAVASAFTHFRIGLINGDFWPFVPLARLPEFVLGITAGLIWKNRTNGRFDRLAPYLAMGSALLIFALMNLPLHAKWFFSGVFAPLPALLICALACGRGKLAGLLAWRPVVILGGASYSLYILHWPSPSSAIPGSPSSIPILISSLISWRRWPPRGSVSGISRNR